MRFALAGGNVLGLKEGRLAKQLLIILVGYEFEEERGSNLYAEAFKIMDKVRVSFYDAAYHATALKRGGTFLTADTRYVEKAKDLGHLALLPEWAGFS
ncbi:type II toxin-antitoxin system VapC family toxin [Acidobacteria bacterium AH-259-O06]|nr:type II toxin-antitoxin system VapC family toxin [Acidobacteria bacterium AH-259-O06]